MNIDGLMLIHEMRTKDPLFEKLFECLDRDERNKIWEAVTGWEYDEEEMEKIYRNKEDKDDNNKTR